MVKAIFLYFEIGTVANRDMLQSLSEMYFNNVFCFIFRLMYICVYIFGACIDLYLYTE